ncbi:helix-turn-helix domain-containing protein [Winogradskyella luteola]|uniref:Helix-turn-helix transcriptional regulator n=1 Tax=Winogradskyella luteola TaxID=2828330 RepID=A0A9X1JP73_9FLAO|nr:helix-turn-helix transcriptional regulator [Winogradskyella luteola]MBV7270161.1 helix-turn-helix transcriptional regulator [Winogradskyella luteola]
MNKQIVLEKVGQRIREIRLSKGLTQVELVARMEITTDPNNISRLEAGRSNITLFTIYRLSVALEVPMKELLDVDIPN